MTLEEITIKEMAKAIDIFKKEYIDYRNSLSFISAKESERVSLEKIATQYDCWWGTLHKILNKEQVSLKTLKKICVKILEKQNEQS